MSAAGGAPAVLPVLPAEGHAGIVPAPDPRIEDPAAYRVSFVVLLDGDLVMSPEHLGVAYMAAVLRAAGFTAEIREVAHGREAESLDGIEQFGAHLVCFTLMSLNTASCVRFASALRARMPQVTIACGGPAGTYAGQDVLRTNPYVDVVAVGEGEPTIVDLVQRLCLKEPLTTCPGIWYRGEGGSLEHNPPRPLVHDLDALPFPARDQLLSHGNDLEYVRISTSRGCVARCTFCSAPNLGNRVQSGKAWRGRSPESVLDEVEQIVTRHDFRTLDFVDSTFEDPDGGRVGKARVRAIAEGILDRGLDIFYNCCMRAENWSDDDHDLLDLLVRSGLEKVNVGIESGVPSELLLWEKKATVEDNVRIIRLLREHGIYLAMGFIPFHPYATADTLRQNAEFLRRNSGHNLRRLTERLEVYPGTSIAGRLRDDRLLADDFSDTLDPYGYAYQDDQVARLALHFASLYNNDDYHEHGVITEQSAVFEFETFNVVVQTFVSRTYRAFHALPGAAAVVESFKDYLHDVRQSMAEFNHEFFLDNLEAVLEDRLDPAVRRRQVAEVEQRFGQAIDQIRAEQLRVGRRLQRLGADLSAISSRVVRSRAPGAPRTYTGGGTANW